PRCRRAERQPVDTRSALFGAFWRRTRGSAPAPPPAPTRNRFGLHQRVQLLQPRDVTLHIEQLVADRTQLCQRVLVHLPPLPLVVFADLVAQLRLGQPLGGALLLFLELEQKFLALRDELPRGIGVS